MTKYATTMHKMYPDGGRTFARTEMINKLFILHDLTIVVYYKVYFYLSEEASVMRGIIFWQYQARRLDLGIGRV